MPDNADLRAGSAPRRLRWARPQHRVITRVCRTDQLYRDNTCRVGDDEVLRRQFPEHRRRRWCVERFQTEEGQLAVDPDEQGQPRQWAALALPGMGPVAGGGRVPGRDLLVGKMTEAPRLLRQMLADFHLARGSRVPRNDLAAAYRSEERRGGEEGRSRGV